MKGMRANSVWVNRMRFEDNVWVVERLEGDRVSFVRDDKGSIKVHESRALARWWCHAHNSLAKGFGCKGTYRVRRLVPDLYPN